MPGTGEFGVKMNTMPKYVVTSTKDKLEWTGSRVIRGDVAEEIRKLKKQPGKDLLLSGSAMVFNAMMKENLIDLYRFMVHPVALGSGARLFTEDVKRNLELTDIKRFGKGIVVLEYVPAN
jgi:dihydrofolate reductase